MQAQRDRWQVGLLCREALLNCFAPRARLYPLVLIAAVLGTAGPLLGAWQSTQLQHQLRAESLQGRNLVAISALNKSDPVAISVASCNHLTRDVDILTAGTVQSVETSGFLQLGTGIPILQASPTLPPQLQTNDALVGPGLTRLTRPFTLLLPTGDAVSAVEGEPQPDELGTDTAVTLALPPSVRWTATCYAKIAPASDPQQVGTRLVTELDVTGGPLAATTAFTEPQNPITVFTQRLDRFLPVALGIIGGALAATIARRRSGEWAAYRMSGTGSRSMALIITLELAAQAGVFIFSATIASAVLQTWTLAAQSAVLLSVGGGCGWVVAGIAATADLPFRKPTDLAKDR